MVRVGGDTLNPYEFRIINVRTHGTHHIYITIVCYTSALRVIVVISVRRSVRLYVLSPVRPSVRPQRPCLRYNSLPFSDRITTFAPMVHWLRVRLIRIGKVIRVTFHSQSHSGVARKPLISQSGQFVERLETDLRPCRLTYESQSDLRPTCEQLATEIRSRRG